MIYQRGEVGFFLIAAAQFQRMFDPSSPIFRLRIGSANRIKHVWTKYKTKIFRRTQGFKARIFAVGNGRPFTYCFGVLSDNLIELHISDLNRPLNRPEKTKYCKTSICTVHRALCCIFGRLKSVNKRRDATYDAIKEFKIRKSVNVRHDVNIKRVSIRCRMNSRP